MISCYGLVFARLATVCRPTIVCLGSAHLFINTFQAIFNNTSTSTFIKEIKTAPSTREFLRTIFTAVTNNTRPIAFTGSQRGGPWSHGAVKFLLWSPEPYHFTDWSPDPFLDVQAGAQRHFARSLEPSIFKFDHSSSQIALILDYRLFVFVCAC